MPRGKLRIFDSVGKYPRDAFLRWVGGGLILALAVLLQYGLANIPAKIDVAATEAFPERAVSLGEHEVVIQGPVVRTASEPQDDQSISSGVQPSLGGLLFFHDGNPNEIVDAHFHKAAISKTSVHLLTRLGIKPPGDPTEISYSTSEASSKSSGEPCRTSVRIYLEGNDDHPAEVSLFRKEESGYHAYRDLWMRAQGANLTVDFLTIPPEPDNLESPGCKKDLLAGSFKQTLPGSFPIQVAVPEGSEFHFNFAPWREDASSVVLQDDFRPFEFGISPLSGSGMRIERVQPPGTVMSLCPCWLTSWPARCSEASAPFEFSELEIGRTNLRLKVSGEGFVKLNGKYKTRDLFEWAKNNTMLVLLLGALNTGLLGWVKKSFFVKPKPPQPLFDDD